MNYKDKKYEGMILCYARAYIYIHSSLKKNIYIYTKGKSTDFALYGSFMAQAAGFKIY